MAGQDGIVTEQRFEYARDDLILMHVGPMLTAWPSGEVTYPRDELMARRASEGWRLLYYSPQEMIWERPV